MMVLEDQETELDIAPETMGIDDVGTGEELEVNPNDDFDGFDPVSNMAGLQSDLRDSRDLVTAATSLDGLEDYREELVEKPEITDGDMDNYRRMAEIAVGGNDPVEVGFMPVTENYGSYKLALEAAGVRNAVALEGIHDKLKGIGASIKKRLRRFAYYFKVMKYKILSLKKDLDKADFPAEGVSVSLKVYRDLKYGDHSTCKSMEEYASEFIKFVDFSDKLIGELVSYGCQLTDKMKDTKKIFSKTTSKEEDQKAIIEMIKDFHHSMLKLPTMHKVNSGGSDRYWEVFASQTFIGEVYVEYRTALSDNHMKPGASTSEIRSAVSKTSLGTKVVVGDEGKTVVRFEHVTKAELHKALDAFLKFWNDQIQQAHAIDSQRDWWMDDPLMPADGGIVQTAKLIRDVRKNLNTRLFISDHIRSEVINCSLSIWMKGDGQIKNGLRMSKKIIWSA
jgi:hypothetical protein